MNENDMRVIILCMSPYFSIEHALPLSGTNRTIRASLDDAWRRIGRDVGFPESSCNGRFVVDSALRASIKMKHIRQVLLAVKWGYHVTVGESRDQYESRFDYFVTQVDRCVRDKHVHLVPRKLYDEVLQIRTCDLERDKIDEFMEVSQGSRLLTMKIQQPNLGSISVAYTFPSSCLTNGDSVCVDIDPWKVDHFIQILDRVHSVGNSIAAYISNEYSESSDSLDSYLD